ncbi:D-arabinono-1,4-lactone oxidase [Pseudobacteriovorax antillogorgiicola]|uniref:FAD-dependent oxidoreductase n=1 Tax=Pseudobacteriovorax antillogorgiicola TaxID=1513793 RepID=A0A1Y6CE67_9BACT|nr:D-arabinono-1,4-lactone oxidase [Pseudobacteriovorax antillogorgiicola]TCS48012.1 FAD-dependent oxidoreductase [Pseudobacteriovorax antillogorgiicola]SMF58559.1 FAD-dependent oxidoreductase [Pseudobacteriovorax antillogorgiicola]
MVKLLWVLPLALLWGLKAWSAPAKVLYLTDYSNGYHDYQAQGKATELLLEQQLDSDVSIVGRSYEELTKFLGKENFGEGYDLIVYNACLADTREYVWAENIIRQTRDLGVPMILLHCAMHNFRGTSSDLGFFGRRKLDADRKAWENEQAGKEFPIWWRFSGVDSTSHSLFQKKLPTRIETDHPIVANVPEGWVAPKDELYYNITRTDDVIPLLSTDDGKELLAWLHPVGKSMVFATTLGHKLETYENTVFQDLLGRAARFLTNRLDDQESANRLFYNYSSSIRCNPSDVITASTIAEVQDAVRLAVARDRALKVVSIDNPNSYSEVLCPEKGGIVINVAPMNKLLNVDAVNKMVTVQPGITIDQLGRELEAYKLIFPTTADYSGITVAGGMGTGAHHSSLKRHAGIHDYVEKLTIVDGTGSIRILEGAEAREAAVHLGYLGAIVEVVLKVEDMFKLRYGYKAGSDRDLEQLIEQEVRSHDYARVSWFVGVGRYIVDYYDQVPVEEAGESYHNLWETSAGPTSIFGSLPYDALNRLPQIVQCGAAGVRANAWAAPIKAVNSSGREPVGFAHRMLGSTCAKGRCPWDFGAVSRTQELAIPIAELQNWMQDVRGIIAARKACFPVLGVYMRFAKASDSWLSSSHGADSMMFEIHIPKETDPNRYEQGTEVYDEIVQMTYQKYQGRPHWAKNSTPIFKDTLVRYGRAADFVDLKNELDPMGRFENEFWNVIASDSALKKPYPGCNLSRDCICQSDADCGTGYQCAPGAFFDEAKVCVKK